MSKVSVIVPIYNKEKYLERCIESVLRQTEPDFDLILVNDGSTDQGGEICEKYRKADRRITVIHQSNRGPSLARNMGIHQACVGSDSRWITFLDADDALHPRFLEIMLHEGEARENTITACSLNRITPGDSIGEINEFPAREIDINTLYSVKGTNMNGFSACGKLFPKEIFIRIRFPAGLRNEDMYTAPVLMNEAEHIVFIDAPMYCYYMLENSYIHSEWKPQKLEEIYAAEFVARYLKNNGCMDGHLGTLLRLQWIIGRQKTEIRKSGAKHKAHFLLHLFGKQLEINRRIRHAKREQPGAGKPSDAGR